MDILDKIELNNYQESYSDFAFNWKAYQYLHSMCSLSENELYMLIDYFAQVEKYEICERLKNKWGN